MNRQTDELRKVRADLARAHRLIKSLQRERAAARRESASLRRAMRLYGAKLRRLQQLTYYAWEDAPGKGTFDYVVWCLRNAIGRASEADIQRQREGARRFIGNLEEHP